MRLLLFQAEWPDWVKQAIGAAIVAVITWTLARPKNQADTGHALAQTNAILSVQLKVATEQLAENSKQIPVWKQKLLREEHKNEQLGKQAEEWERKFRDLETLVADAGGFTPERLAGLKRQAEIILDAISRLDFMPTGKPTPEDTAALHRLDEMRTASREICEMVKDETIGR